VHVRAGDERAPHALARHRRNTHCECPPLELGVVAAAKRSGAAESGDGIHDHTNP
jgi:hypothetical protein